ncbi:hypothetical protein AOL_s00076g150 [Orbilia oligospora ATCC 24927]|uniref:Uncharacterized protein n=2 Tax=Orbilia oligospora TaxID=2813651 RepID=G1X943_ARTOA|nr:hypothetical protein AOL_s00076g150 [Orbilia oligospora ATCC 24927]EGX50386.1 hypothetical protein AOL_s00076g150 [Orbilia oligospora ATCC 24927]KAF3277661.1 hypothetical protein TWF970_004918 [Orbilia oligospora]
MRHHTNQSQLQVIYIQTTSPDGTLTKMSKRAPDQALEELVLSGIGSPRTKRVKTDSIADEEEMLSAEIPANGVGRLSLQPTAQSEGEEDEMDDIMEEEEESEAKKWKDGPPTEFSDLYLDTVNRNLLDFDFEKLCSISLSNINVYACLVCGKYFQGRGQNSHAYFHALDESHHVFINIATLRIYVLPESYEVKQKSLDDIKYVANPTYTREDVAKLDKEETKKWDLTGKRYTPGFVGLNNIKENDYLNVVVHALAHVTPLRNYMMLENMSSRPELAQRFSILVRKIWNSRAFRGHVSPHELLQEISLRSSKKFTLTTQSDPVEFLSWFVNNLHLSLGGSKTAPGSSIVQKVFQGRLRVESQAITAKADASDRLRFEEAGEVKTDMHRYMMLTLELPPAPLFQDELDKNIIPQVPLTAILSKYDGTRAQELLGQRKRYKLLQPLPPYLVFHIKRFSKNKFVFEKNPTIVTFPSTSLDMSPYAEGATGPIWYDLTANIVHESVARKGGPSGVKSEAGEEGHAYKVQLKDKARDEWVQVQDLIVEEIRKEILFLGESYIQVWERRRDTKKKAAS